MALAQLDDIHTVDVSPKKKSFSMPSPSSSSMAEKRSQESDDHASIDTMATEKTRYYSHEQHTHTESPAEKDRADTHTSCYKEGNSNPRVSADVSRTSIASVHASERDNLAKSIYGLHTTELPDESDSESDASSFRRKRERDQMRSTMTSLNSFASSGSNYDLLLARLAPDKPSSASTASSNSNRSSCDHVYSENENEAHGDDIDWDFWALAITDFDRVATSEPGTLRRHLRKGIPATLRGKIWQLLIDSKDADLEKRYMDLLKEESIYERAIRRDLPRIMANNDRLQSKDGPEALFNVTKAYALYDPHVGYCSSLSLLARPLLLNMPEEEAFCMLVKMMERFDLRGHFVLGQELLMRRLFQFEGLLSDRCPRLRRHLDASGLRAHSYAVTWFQALFSSHFPDDTVFRLYDVLFAEGIESLHRVGLALLEKSQGRIQRLDQGHLKIFLCEDLFGIYENNTDALIRDACQIEISPSRLARLGKEYQNEVASVGTETAMLRRQQKALTETVHDLDKEIQTMRGMYTEVENELIKAKIHLTLIQEEKGTLHQQSLEYKETLAVLPDKIEKRVKEEMVILGNKNAELMARNLALEDQLLAMEKLVIEIKDSYSRSENDKRSLQDKLFAAQ